MSFVALRGQSVDTPPAEEARMRKVVLYALMSLDGAVDHPSRYFPATDPTVRGAPVFDRC